MAQTYLPAPQPVIATAWGAWENKGTLVEIIGSTTGQRKVVLREPLRWVDKDGTVITIPEGYVSDGATIPRIAWWLMGGKLSLDYIRAAFVHDYSVVYHNAMAGSWAQSNEIAAERFYCGLRADSMGFYKASACRIAVTRFGPQW